jgi:hypothetical protein
MDLLLVGICLAVIVGLYFHNNPMDTTGGSCSAVS